MLWDWTFNTQFKKDKIGKQGRSIEFALTNARAENYS